MVSEHTASTPASTTAFASDNYSGAHAEVIAAIVAANDLGHVIAYGDDPVSARLRSLVVSRFGRDARIEVVFNGTGANIVALTALTPQWGAVITPSTSHVVTDEAGALVRQAGIPWITVPTPDGKLTPALLAGVELAVGDVHRNRPATVSIANPTEVGTVYTVDELAALVEWAHGHGMRIYADGARLFNAAAHLGVDLAAITSGVGLDAFSIGATKNGGLGAEAVVIRDATAGPGALHGPDPEHPDSLVSRAAYARKYLAQLPSKARFLSAQVEALLADDLGLRLAEHSNDLAARLRSRLDAAVRRGAAGTVTFTQPTESNAVFARIPAEAAAALRNRYRFYDWDARRGEVRWMTSWDTTAEAVDAFADAIVAACSAAAPSR